MTSEQHVVIVGGSSGIGLSTARLLLVQGYKVTITGRSASRLASARDTLSGDIHTLVMNAAEPSGLPEGFAHIGSFSHLVLALGSSRGAGPFASVSLDEVRAGFEEKVYAHFATAQAALPYLALNGSLTFISAVTAHAAMPGTAGIGAANAAIAALVPVLAAELQPMRVNAVSPGVTDTPWWDFLSEEDKASVFADYASKTPVGRIGKPDDIAQAVIFLIANTFITGQTIVCDGGLHLKG
ncbi:NAD(P)-dependent dehydrogenase, short-chain alcohol dehydrogenase family [Kosakonia arachidis]|uniref:NAD(P)-dependent dehydrogenase, short-chain alcohol dehydrogenase family n=1 Tax=Kosakonia arachidis TaxID=551989 RepID=A0A1I7BAS2_9ENTR|nr:SDR family oxidoreductase [Kosakonia arachidis]SFT84325.1 NAD(P)-dependent dehydrogenase, short-chain alcohol dehydrogenase family [Kosakonia arachidis]